VRDIYLRSSKGNIRQIASGRNTGGKKDRGGLPKWRKTVLTWGGVVPMRSLNRLSRKNLGYLGDALELKRKIFKKKKGITG